MLIFFSLIGPMYLPNNVLSSGFSLQVYVVYHNIYVGSAVARDQRAAGLSLTGVTALWSLNKTHLS